MRMLALAAACGVGLLAGGIAVAEQYTAPSGQMTFNTPAGWRTQPRASASGDATVVLAFNPTSDCYFFALPNPSTVHSPANAVHNTTAPLAASAWLASAGAINDFFAGSTPTLVSQSVDTTAFWPVQRAELQGPNNRTVYGAITARPGVEIRGFCSGAASASAYDSIFASLGHPNDSVWQQEAGQQAAERQAQQTAATQATTAADQAAADAAAQAAICNDPTISTRDPRRRRCRN